MVTSVSTLSTEKSPPIATPTTHGTVTLYTYQTTPTASELELADATAFAAKINGDGDGSRPGSIAIGAAGISAAATVAGTLLTGALAGSSIANTILSNQQKKSSTNSPQPTPQGQVQFTFANMSSNPLVLDTVKNGAGCMVSNVPSAMSAGQSDVLVLTNPGEIDGTAKLEIGLKIGNGALTNGKYNHILVNLYLNYSATNSMWIMTPSVDSMAGAQGSPAVVAEYGCTFAPSTSYAGYPSFSFYFTPVQTGSGSMTITFYDH